MFLVYTHHVPGYMGTGVGEMPRLLTDNFRVALACIRNPQLVGDDVTKSATIYELEPGKTLERADLHFYPTHEETPKSPHYPIRVFATFELGRDNIGKSSESWMCYHCRQHFYYSPTDLLDPNPPACTHCQSPAR